MNRIILCCSIMLCFIFLGVKSERSSTDFNKIIWEEGLKLSWADFKARPNPMYSFHAYTMTGFGYDVVSNTSKDVDFFVYSYFDEYNSWVKSKQKTDHLLAHEQLHFDMCELYRRKFAQRLTQKKFFSYKNISSEMEQIFNETFNDFDAAQRKYDKETNHSMLKKEQVEWQTYVTEEIKKLDEFRVPVVKLFYH